MLFFENNIYLLLIKITLLIKKILLIIKIIKSIKLFFTKKENSLIYSLTIYYYLNSFVTIKFENLFEIKIIFKNFFNYINFNFVCLNFYLDVNYFFV